MENQWHWRKRALGNRCSEQKSSLDPDTSGMATGTAVVFHVVLLGSLMEG